MEVRRVVAGELADGRSGIGSDSLAEKSHDFLSIPGLSDTLVWAISAAGGGDKFSDITTTLRHSVPRAGEVFVRVVQIPPDSVFASPGFDPVAAQAETAAVMPDVDLMAEGKDGAHRTPTHDIITVVEGALTLIMDNGDSADLGPGDVVIQLSGMHRWSNRTEQPARIFFVSLPA
jgi:hypothetical protein